MQLSVRMVIIMVKAYRASLVLALAGHKYESCYHCFACKSFHAKASLLCCGVILGHPSELG